MTDKTRITEIAADHYVISIYVREFNLRFNHFLIKDEEPLLFHAGMKQMFPLMRDAVARIIDPATLRWISFSHFEADECGALNEWLAIAPQAAPVCGLVGAAVSVNDFSMRPARVLAHDEILKIGRYRLRFRRTPHVPHNWEASLLFEEVTRTLLCSDLFTHEGDVEPLTESDVVDRAKSHCSKVKRDLSPIPTLTRRSQNQSCRVWPSFVRHDWPSCTDRHSWETVHGPCSTWQRSCVRC